MSAQLDCKSYAGLIIPNTAFPARSKCAPTVVESPFRDILSADIVIAFALRFALLLSQLALLPFFFPLPFLLLALLLSLLFSERLLKRL